MACTACHVSAAAVYGRAANAKGNKIARSTLLVWVFNFCPPADFALIADTVICCYAMLGLTNTDFHSFRHSMGQNTGGNHQRPRLHVLTNVLCFTRCVQITVLSVFGSNTVFGTLCW